MSTTPIERTKCAFCSERDMWPDRCPTDDCEDVILDRHALDDHRRCSPDGCEWARRYLAEVIRLGVAECERTGLKFAVVSTIEPDGQPMVLRAFARTQQAKPFRTSYGKRAGLDWGQTHGLLPVVREDGWLV